MHRHKFEETCIGNRASAIFKSRSSKCRSSIQKLDNIKRSTEYTQFMKAMSEVMNVFVDGDDKWQAYVQLMNLKLIIVNQMIWKNSNYVKKKFYVWLLVKIV